MNIRNYRLTRVRRGSRGEHESAVHAFGEACRRGREKERMKKLLEEKDVKEKLRLTEDDIQMLDEIIAAPGRNAIAQLGALKLKMMYTLSQPKQEGSDEPVTVVIKTLPGGEGADRGAVIEIGGIDKAKQLPSGEADEEEGIEGGV